MGRRLGSSERDLPEAFVLQEMWKELKLTLFLLLLSNFVFWVSFLFCLLVANLKYSYFTSLDSNILTSSLIDEDGQSHLTAMYISFYTLSVVLSVLSIFITITLVKLSFTTCQHLQIPVPSSFLSLSLKQTKRRVRKSERERLLRKGNKESVDTIIVLICYSTR